MSDQRPTTLLHDAWGASRPATDEEIAHARRMDTRNTILVITGAAAFWGFLVAGVCYLVVW